MLKRFLPFLIIAVISFSLGALFFAGDEQNPITKEDISHAEKIIGIEFSDAERDSMLDELFSSLKNYKVIREAHLDNSVMPAVQFNPIPQNFKFEKEQKPLIFSNYSGIKLPADKNELAFYSIGQLAELIKTKQITSVELTNFYLDRLKRYSPKIQSVITLTEELALEQAKKADAEIIAGKYRGMLHGIPYGVKDLLATKNYKTTWGSVPYKDQMIDMNAAVVKKLQDAGAVLAAKLTMGELAWGDVWFGGKTRNPWDIQQGSSGSSAGSASSVSAGLLPFAIGTETYGSIISPSTICGVTGLRPSYGRVSRTGAMALSWSMDKIGPICRNAEDCAIVFNAIYGPDEADPTVYDLPFNYNSDLDLKKLKVAYLKNDFSGDYDFKKNDSISLEIIKNFGIELIPVELPDYPVYDMSIILSAEAAAAFDELTLTGKDDLMIRQIKNAWPNSFRASRFIPAVEYVNANRLRTLLIKDLNKLMQQYDVLIAPSWEGKNLLMTNLSGHPAVVVPNGFSEEGTPTSMVFLGNLFDEGTIIAFAKAFQDASEFHLKHPPMFSDNKK